MSKTKKKRFSQATISSYQIVSFTALRIVMGWLFLYAGIQKIVNPSWTSAGYLQNAKTFTEFYHWMLQPAILPLVDFLNMWGLTLIGICLIMGVFVRSSSFLGIILMLLYYFPVLQGLRPSPHSFIVNEHIVYAFILFLFMTNKEVFACGVGNACLRLKFVRQNAFLKKWIR